MRSIIFAVLISPFTSSLHAQYDDLLKNPKITWVAEHTADFELNPLYNQEREDEFNLLSVIRVNNPWLNRGFYAEPDMALYLSQLLLKGLQDGRFACYADSALSEPLNSRAVFHRLFGRGAYTMEDSLLLIRNGVDATGIHVFRVRQFYYFDADKHVFQSQLLAIAPLVDILDEEGNFQEYRPLLWIKMPQLREKLRKSVQRDAVYAVQTYMRGNAPRETDLVVRKGRLDFQSWATSEMQKPAHPVFVRDFLEFEPIDPVSLKAQIITSDTLTSFNDAGEAQIEAIVPKNWISQVEKIRFVQNWYYDERRKILDCRIVAAAPLATVRDAQGNPRYDRPLFYVKY